MLGFACFTAILSVAIISIHSALAHTPTAEFPWLCQCCNCSRSLIVLRTCSAMDEYEKSVITNLKDAKKFTFSQDPSTVTVMDSGNIGGGVETGSTGERDVHSDATSENHATLLAVSDAAKQQEDSSRSASSPASSDSGREAALSRPNDDVGDGHSHSGLHVAESTPSSQQQRESTSGHASDFQSAEGLASDMPDRKGIQPPDSSGDRATDITGIPYIQ